jgi:hypothetical protein
MFMIAPAKLVMNIFLTFLREIEFGDNRGAARLPQFMARLCLPSVHEINSSSSPPYVAC